MISRKRYYVYILTNPGRKVLYTGMTNDLKRRQEEHYENRGNPKTFAGRFYCYNLLYYEEFKYVNNAINRENEIKGWSRARKEELIRSANPKMEFLFFIEYE